MKMVNLLNFSVTLNQNTPQNVLKLCSSNLCEAFEEKKRLSSDGWTRLGIDRANTVVALRVFLLERFVEAEALHQQHVVRTTARQLLLLQPWCCYCQPKPRPIPIPVWSHTIPIITIPVCSHTIPIPMPIPVPIPIPIPINNMWRGSCYSSLPRPSDQSWWCHCKTLHYCRSHTFHFWRLHFHLKERPIVWKMDMHW